MPANSQFLKVIDGQRSSRTALRMAFGESAVLVEPVNRLLAAVDASVTVDRALDGDDLSIDMVNADALPAGAHLSFVRGLRGVCRSLSSDLNLVVVALNAELGVGHPDSSMLLRLARQFSVDRIASLSPTPGDAPMAFIPEYEDLEICSYSISEYLEAITRTPSRHELVIVPFSMYETVRDMLTGLTCARQHAVSISVAERVRIEGMAGIDHHTALVPKLIAALWQAGENAAAETLEQVWLACLEQGIVPAGFETIQPYARELPLTAFLERLASSVGQAPRRLQTSLAVTRDLRPALRLVGV